MKTTKKDFDCVEMMHQGARRLYEETKGMSVQEELDFWRRRHAELMQELKDGSWEES